MCDMCFGSLKGDNPRLPKFALANDFWMGRLPPVLRGLSRGAWMLLALARPFIHRYGCLNDSGKFIPHDQRIKAFIGNVCAFTQADGGALIDSLPPRAADLVGRIMIAFTGTDEDPKKARLEELQVPLDEFKNAYRFLRQVNYVYADVAWDEVAEQELQAQDATLGLPACLASCVRLDQPGSECAATRSREGPADAVASVFSELGQADVRHGAAEDMVCDKAVSAAQEPQAATAAGDVAGQGVESRHVDGGAADPRDVVDVEDEPADQLQQQESDQGMPDVPLYSLTSEDLGGGLVRMAPFKNRALCVIPAGANVRAEAREGIAGLLFAASTAGGGACGLHAVFGIPRGGLL